MLLHLPFTFLFLFFPTYTNTDMQLWWLQETKCLRQSHVCVFTHTRSFTRSRQLLSLLHSCICLRSADRLGRISLRYGRQAVLIILRSAVDPRLNICICVFLNYDIALVTNLSQGWVQRCAARTSTWRCGLCKWCPLVLANGSEVAHGCSWLKQGRAEKVTLKKN